MSLIVQRDTPTITSVQILKKKASKVAKFLVPKKSLILKLTFKDKNAVYDLNKTFSEVTHLHKVLKKEYPDIDVPHMPRIPTKAKNCDTQEWLTFFRYILDDPTYSESGYLRTFISTQCKNEEGMQNQFGEVIKEGPLVYQKKSAKYKRYRQVECWCVIRLRLFYYYRSRFDTTPMGMIFLDDCAVEVGKDKIPKDAPIVQPKSYKAVGMPLEDSSAVLETTTEQKSNGESKNENDAITLHPKGSHKHTFFPAATEDRDAWLSAIEAVAKSRVTTHFRVVSTLLVQVEKASQLTARDTNGFSDPYAIAHIENQQQKTATIRKTLDPVWHETFQFHVSWYSAVLYLSLWDEDNLKASDFLGKIAIPIAALPVDEEVDIWQALAPRDKQRVSGLVNLRIKYSFTLDDEEKQEGKSHLKTFGVPLASAECPIPPVIQRAMKFVEENALDVEGLFRLSANSIEMNELRRSIDQGGDVDFAAPNANIHNFSGLIKLWLRELPEPALTFDAYPRFLAALRESKSDSLLPNLKECIKSLPDAHRALLGELLPFLHRVSLAQEKTRMTTANLSVVFSPSLLRKRVETLDSLMIDSADVAKVTAILIDNATALVASA